VWALARTRGEATNTPHQTRTHRKTKILSKLVIASALALSVAAPAFAVEETTLLERNTYTLSTSVDAMAYAPAHAPAAAKSAPVRDFGIGSQS
jgi:hypothetical protein